MRSTLALAVLVLISTSAQAEIFVVSEAFHFSLAQGGVAADPADSDLDVTPYGVNARFGIKRASRGGALDYREVTVLKEPYDLQDAQGGKWRLWIRSVSEAAMVVELVRARPVELPVTETYQLTSVSINGQEASPTFPPLTLNANGTYRLGRASGHFTRSETGVTLDGVPAHFGKGSYWVNLDGLTFSYFVGNNRFELKYKLNQSFAAL